MKFYQKLLNMFTSAEQERINIKNHGIKHRPLYFTGEWFSKDKTEWYTHGELHRNHGPAVECSDGTKYWYLYGEPLNENEFNKLAKMLKG